MTSGLPDFSKYVVLKGSEVTLDVDVVGSVTLDVNVVGSVVLDVNIKSQAVTLNVNIESQSVTLDVKITGSDVTLNVNVTNASITIDIGSPLDANGNVKTAIVDSVQIDVNIAASAVTLDVNIKSQAVTLDVNIKAQDVTLNVNVQGTASVSIDNATVYLNVKNDKMIAGYYIFDFTPEADTLLSDYRHLGIFIRNVRGAWKGFGLKCKNVSGSSQSLTICVSINPASPPLLRKVFSIPDGTDGVHTDWNFWNVFWEYDTAFIYIEDNNPDVQVYAKSVGWGNCAFYHGLGSFSSAKYGIGLRLEIAGSKYDIIPVGGTVNTIQIPNSSSMVVSEHVTVNPGGSAVLINIEGTGEVSRVYLDCAGVNQAYVKLKITIDGRVVLDKYLSWIDLFEHSAPAPAAPVESYQWDNTSKTYVFAFNYTFKFRKQFKVEIFNEHDADTLSVLPFCYYDLIM